MSRLYHFSFISVGDILNQHFPAICVATKPEIFNETWGHFPRVFVVVGGAGGMGGNNIYFKPKHYLFLTPRGFVQHDIEN